ncbi:discoidin domain-containing protein [Sporolactobacillus shoreicorticis]|uniref:Discoidin domain-containing protein n=1 Tax=Sporolactobacillus shoreicorticis TaxID=1923877 RepID=A0ABW5S093_9BACL|nr:discoidin domain-containing protein [Sporolactobacillus shoreicorticis]MCO7124682.1 discoidin domain-containing protein [Sporolactobacillus shoreicorticis]
MKKKRHMALHILIIILLIAGMGLPVNSKVSYAESSTAPVVTHNVKLLITKENGFVHPGISIYPQRLIETRTQLIKGRQPWTAYYQAMASADYASKEFKAANLKAGTFDTPKNATFKNNSQEITLSADGFRAYTQAIMYYLTGDKKYRYNAIRLVRIWENMDPNQYAYYADSHIHVPVPFYYMVSAAELLKYTSVDDPIYNDPDSSDGDTQKVDLRWKSEDNQKLIKNLIDPTVNTFLTSNNKYLAQHLYSITGVFAGSIFKNDKTAYDRTVEWATVNATTDKPLINGSLANLFHKIDAKDPRNPVGQSYVQHLEMGRDENHAKDDVLCLIGIARILSQQETKVDPKKGTVSTKSNAQTPYRFLTNRLLAGAEQFYRYNRGYTVPWVKLKQDGGKTYPAWDANGTDKIIDFGDAISEDSRGRLGKLFSSSELYDAYRYGEHYSKTKLNKIAPNIVNAAEHLNAPIFYDGTTLTNFWGSYSDNKMTEIGAEYWLSIPKDKGYRLSEAVPTTQPKNANVSFAKRAVLLDTKRAKQIHTGSENYIRVRSAKNRSEIKETEYDKLYRKDKTTARGANQLALSSLVKDNGTSGYVALRIRSNAAAKLLISGSNDGAEPYQTAEIPDTHGKWINLIYSTRTDQIQSRSAKQSGYMDFYAVISDSEAKVDFDQLAYLNRTGGIQTSVPSIDETDGNTYYLVKNESFKKQLKTENTTGATFSLDNAPAGMSIDQSGQIEWKPTSETKKSVLVRIDNGTVVRTVRLTFNVVADREEAYHAIIKNFDSDQEYTTTSLKNVNDEQQKVRNLINSGDSDRFLSELQSLSEAIQNLELLNPKLSDGTLNYNAYASMTEGTAGSATINLQNLIDNDPATYDGNLLVPVIIDFGSSYRISAQSFAFEARTGFPNRLQGANVYGSNDKTSWTLLTEKETSQTNKMETVAVKDTLVDSTFRYLKIQVDNPGPDTDPMYPGISTRSEFHIFGTRHQVDLDQ